MASAQAAPAAVPYPLSRELLEAVLADRTSDRFVCELIWPRLGYELNGSGTWSAGPATSAGWRESFPIEPQFIAERPPAVALTPAAITPNTEAHIIRRFCRTMSSLQEPALVRRLIMEVT